MLQYFFSPCLNCVSCGHLGTRLAHKDFGITYRGWMFDTVWHHFVWSKRLSDMGTKWKRVRIFYSSRDCCLKITVALQLFNLKLQNLLLLWYLMTNVTQVFSIIINKEIMTPCCYDVIIYDNFHILVNITLLLSQLCMLFLVFDTSSMPRVDCHKFKFFFFLERW